ncbi:MAG: hypothetical protein ACE5F3_00430 [Mariprofundaceae bacterium]
MVTPGSIPHTLLTALPQYILYGLILLCGIFSAGAISSASDSLSDVVAKEQVIREIALPEGLSSAQSIAVDAAGRVWFSEKIGKKLAVFDPITNEFKTHTLPASWGNVGFSKFALSPDGDIWFTLNRWVEDGKDPHMLGRFTPADGYFTKYNLSIGVLPKEILVDARGMIWFSAYNKNGLYRVNPKNFAIKGYAIPAANSYPSGLASDRNGNIWFSAANANKIGKFVPGKDVFYEYELPTPFANPGAISIDKDGKVWFVESSANRLGLFYPDLQRFDEAIIPTPNSSPNALVHDSSGNVWFLEYRGNKVGIFNPKSAIFREFTIPNFSSLPGDMAIDHKRSILWFTQGSTEAKRLGMLSMDKVLASPGK